VAVSGAFGGAFLEVAQLLGARATLLKPVSPDRLLAAVRGVLSEGATQKVLGRSPRGKEPHEAEGSNHNQ
jgi:DNA-binding NarL/FixJ family response regulator